MNKNKEIIKKRERERESPVWNNMRVSKKKDRIFIFEPTTPFIP